MTSLAEIHQLISNTGNHIFSVSALEPAISEVSALVATLRLNGHAIVMAVTTANDVGKGRVPLTLEVSHYLTCVVCAKERAEAYA